MASGIPVEICGRWGKRYSVHLPSADFHAEIIGITVDFTSFTGYTFSCPNEIHVVTGCTNLPIKKLKQTESPAKS